MGRPAGADGYLALELTEVADALSKMALGKQTRRSEIRRLSKQVSSVADRLIGRG